MWIEIKKIIMDPVTNEIIEIPEEKGVDKFITYFHFFTGLLRLIFIPIPIIGDSTNVNRILSIIK